MVLPVKQQRSRVFRAHRRLLLMPAARFTRNQINHTTSGQLYRTLASLLVGRRALSVPKNKTFFCHFLLYDAASTTMKCRKSTVQFKLGL